MKPLCLIPEDVIDDEIVAQEIEFLNNSEDDTQELEDGEIKEDHVDEDSKKEGEEEDEDKAAWLATSRKRKEVFDRSNAHLQPLAKRPRAPGGSITNPVTITKTKPSPKTKAAAVAPKKYPKINWVERKQELAESDNIAFVDPLLAALLEIVHDVAREVRGGDLNKVGPTFLWNLVPAFVRAIEDTPWGYWFDVRREGENGEREYVVFIQWPYGAVAESLTEGQKKFRQSCLGKVAMLFEEQVRTFMSNDSIKVIWSKYYGENMTY